MLRTLILIYSEILGSLANKSLRKFESYRIKSVTNKEIEQYVGILIHMGTFTMSTPKDYRKQRSRFPMIADTMNPNRFCKIKYNFHPFENTIQLSTHKTEIDKLFKVRQLYENILAN